MTSSHPGAPCAASQLDGKQSRRISTHTTRTWKQKRRVTGCSTLPVRLPSKEQRIRRNCMASTPERFRQPQGGKRSQLALRGNWRGEYNRRAPLPHHRFSEILVPHCASKVHACCRNLAFTLVGPGFLVWLPRRTMLVHNTQSAWPSTNMQSEGRMEPRVVAPHNNSRWHTSRSLTLRNQMSWCPHIVHRSSLAYRTPQDSTSSATRASNTAQPVSIPESLAYTCGV